jgi:hypothetical protein
VRKNGWGLDPLGRIACGFLGRATHRCKDDSGLPGRAVARPFGQRAPVPQSLLGCRAEFEMSLGSKYCSNGY